MKKMVKLSLVFGLICSIILSACIYASAEGGVQISQDWEGSSASAVTVSEGNITTGYTVRTQGHFARYNNKIDIIAGIKFKAEIDTGWYSVGFAGKNYATPGLGGGVVNEWNRVYILTPDKTNGKLTVQYFDNGNIILTEVIDFDFSVEHTYGFRLGGDNNYRFAIDGEFLFIRDAISPENMNNYLNNNGQGGYVSVGSFDYVTFTDLRTPVHDWTVAGNVFQDGDRDNGYTLNFKEKGYHFARLNYKHDAVSGISVKINPKDDWYFISFEKDNTSNPGMAATENKIMYLLRPNEANKKLNVSCYNGAEFLVGAIENFDFSQPHTFSFLKMDDAYRLGVDGNFLFAPQAWLHDDFETNYNNNGEGMYITLGCSGWGLLTDIKPVAWTNGAQEKPVRNENGGYDFTVPAGSAVRYNHAIDLKKGVMFRIGKESDWFSFSVETTPKTGFGGLDSPLIDGKKIYIMYIDEVQQKLATNLWNGSVAVPSSTTPDFDTSAYLHLQYKNAGDAWRLYANGQCAMPADAISDDDFNNYFNNGVLYVTLGAASTPAIVTDFRPYSAPDIRSDAGKIKDGILYGLDTIPTFADISQMVTTVNGTLRVYDNSGNQVTDGKISTGFSVSSYLCNGDEAKLTISIYGDIDGNGDFSAGDLVLLKKKLLGTDELSGAALYAADVNGNDEINIVDLVVLKKKQSLT